MPGPIGEGWTAERTELLRARWASGDTASQIAAELGGGITRSGVLGKARRMKLPERTVGGSRPQKPTPFAFGAAQPRPPRIRPQRGRERKPPPVKTVRATAAPVPLRVPLLELKGDSCRWPIGDPRDADFCFCGVTTAPDHRSYCEYHARKSATPPGGGST